MIQVLNMDCMDYLRAMPDQSFDLAIVDPPYGIKQNAHRANNRSKLAKSRKYHDALWDQSQPTSDYFIELRRVCKNQIIWGGNHLAMLINKNSSCWLVWDKHTTGNFADYELAYTSFKTSVRKFSYPWNGMIQGFHGAKKLNEKRIHPTQKPIALYTWILEKYAKPGEIILDTHLGSGSSAIAAHRGGFEFVGIEIDTIYYTDCISRLRTEGIDVYDGS